MGDTLKNDYILHELLESLRQRRKSIRFPKLYGQQRIREICQDISCYYPEVFYTNGFEITETSFQIAVDPVYQYGFREIERLQRVCEQQSAIIVSHVHGNTDYERAVSCHDILIRNIKYYNSGDRENHSIVGALVNRKASCDGFAKVYKYLLDKIGITCVVVTGQAWDYQKNNPEPHAWNMLFLEGKWCHVDVTFDLTLQAGTILRHDYFGLTDRQICRDHHSTSPCTHLASDTTLNYYSRNLLVMNRQNDLKSLISKKIRKREFEFVVKLPDETTEIGLEEKVSKVVASSLEENQFNGNYVINCNFAQRVFSIIITEVANGRSI